jgi:hypothetical protein
MFLYTAVMPAAAADDPAKQVERMLSKVNRQIATSPSQAEKEWIDKFSPFLDPNSDSYLLMGSDFNSASKEEQEKSRLAYASANTLMATYIHGAGSVSRKRCRRASRKSQCYCKREIVQCSSHNIAGGRLERGRGPGMDRYNENNRPLQNNKIYDRASGCKK